MNYLKLLYALPFLFCSTLFSQTSYQSIEGEWSYKLDPHNVGEKEKWYNDIFIEKLKLPGSLNTNGIGNSVNVETDWTGSMWNKDWYESDFYSKYRSLEDTKIVFWLTPNKYYVGKCWYQKKITISKEWENKFVELKLERCHWRTSLWVNGEKMGERNSLSVPHRYELENLKPGKEYTFTLCVDNRITDINPGVDAHSISDNTQSNWNGIVGELSLIARPKSYIENVKIETLLNERKAKLSFNLFSIRDYTKDANLIISVKTGDNSPLLELSNSLILKKGFNNVEIFTFSI